MPSLFIANIRSDYAESVRSATGLVAGSRVGSDTCARFLWQMQSGDVLLTPDAPKDGFLEYVAGMLEVSPSSLNVVVAEGLLDDAFIHSEDVMGALAEQVNGREEWRIAPFLLTRGVVLLADALGIPRPEGWRFAMEGGVELLNLKSTFRRLAAGIGTPIASGTVARSAVDLETELHRLEAVTNAVIIKQDRGGGGHGNVGYSKTSDDRLPGTRLTRFWPSGAAHVASEVWDELVEKERDLVVVEAYLRGGERFFAEWHISQDATDLLSTGLIKYADAGGASISSPEWRGLDLPANLGGGLRTARVIVEAHRLVLEVARLGYRGYLNVDGLIMPDGRLIFHEVNARWGGGLVYHLLASRLLGAQWGDHHIASSVLDLPSGKVDDLVESARKAGIAFDRARAEGVLLLAADSDLGGGSEFLILAASQARAREIEATLSTALSGGCSREEQAADA